MQRVTWNQARDCSPHEPCPPMFSYALHPCNHEQLIRLANPLTALTRFTFASPAPLHVFCRPHDPCGLQCYAQQARNAHAAFTSQCCYNASLSSLPAAALFPTPFWVTTSCSQRTTCKRTGIDRPAHAHARLTSSARHRLPSALAPTLQELQLLLCHPVHLRLIYLEPTDKPLPHHFWLVCRLRRPVL